MQKNLPKKNSLANNTIVAIATPPGRGALGIIRLSGSESFSLLKEVWTGSWPEVQKVALGNIQNPTSKSPIDEVLLCRFASPHSYTGEDMCEISAHGNPLILREIIACFIELGARLAEPGEFTKRAYLSGKLDLVQAEAVSQRIQAQTSRALYRLEHQFRGVFSKQIDAYRQTILATLSWIEADIDFGDREVDDVVPVDALNIAQNVADLLSGIEKTLVQTRSSQILQDGLNVVLCGRPNVGKSSIFNRLHGSERAIVNAQPGTTRDYLEAWMDVEGIPLRMVDTAGLHEPENALEAEGIRRTQDCMQKADLLCLVLDMHAPLGAIDQQFFAAYAQFAQDKELFVLLNKSDLSPAFSRKDLQNTLASFGLKPSFTVETSALNHQGFETLLNQLAKKASSLMGEEGEGMPCLLSLRQEEILTEVRRHLLQIQEGLAQKVSHECLTFDFKHCLNGLSRLLGQELHAGEQTLEVDEILDGVFSRFCIGK